MFALHSVLQARPLQLGKCSGLWSKAMNVVTCSTVQCSILCTYVVRSPHTPYMYCSNIIIYCIIHVMFGCCVAD